MSLNIAILRKLMIGSALFASFAFFTKISQAQDKFLDLLENELKREMTELKNEETAPYYINYRVDETYNISVGSSFGILTRSEQTTKRILTVNVRVGGYELDNYHELRENYNNWLGGSSGSAELPLGNDENAIRQTIWMVTNKAYRDAADKLAKVKANKAVKVEEEDKSEDFTREEAYTYFEPPLKIEDFNIDIPKWEEKVKKYSAPFLEEADIFTGISNFSFKMERKYFVSSEGGKIAQNMTYSRISTYGVIKSNDGMELPLHESYFAYKPDKLPIDDKIISDTKEMVRKLKILQTAPIVDPYTGPALLSGAASGVFFHEIFGHRIEGQRLKNESDAQTFKKQIGKSVLPKHLKVIMDPTINQYDGQDLNGFYKYDDQGMKSSKVMVIEDGILKNFLMSRCPIEKFPRSNGHGRAESGEQPVARQSNLIVETTKPYTKDDLRKMLIKEAKSQGKEYGYLFENVTGGFTFTGRFIPNAFNVNPTEVYRIYVDGRPDELVRGVDLVGTPLAMFSQIEAAGDTAEVFTGTCGAESGGVPVTGISPMLFVKQIEMQKKNKAQDKPPILPRPDKDVKNQTN